jgi:FkbM family methyltransferase
MENSETRTHGPRRVHAARSEDAAHDVFRALRSLKARSRWLSAPDRFPRLKHLLWTQLNATCVRESLTFAARELGFRRRPGLATYHLRSGDATITLRHRTGDIAILEKVFVRNYYELPPPVEALLDALPGPPRLVDLGSNIGLFSAFFLTCFRDAEIVGFEPDPDNLEVLKATIRANGDGRWSVVEACASNRAGTVAFAAGNENLSRIASPGDAQNVMPMVDAFPYLEEADLAKINIEGAEWDLLLDDRFAQLAPPALVMEYHDISCPEPDFHALAIERLHSAGYVTEQVFLTGTEGVLWAWKPVRASRVAQGG